MTDQVAEQAHLYIMSFFLFLSFFFSTNQGANTLMLQVIIASVWLVSIKKLIPVVIICT